jgi:tetratricopeptide (TPR) repeat protein
VPRDLETICLMCLEKDPARRYATAHDLAADLRRFLAGEPVKAQPPSFGYLAGKFVRRYRMPLGVAALVVLLLGVGTLLAFVQITRERNDAIDARKRESTEKEHAERALEDLQRRCKEAEAVWKVVDQACISIHEDNIHHLPGLSVVFFSKGRLDEASRAYRYRDAIAIKPTSAVAHDGLGNVLLRQGKLTEAEAAYREAICLQNDYAEAHCNLGAVLRRQGRFSKSLESYRRGHELGSKRTNWNYPSRRWVLDAERNVALEKKLTAILADESKPADSDERIELAQVAVLKRLSWTATRLYAESFTEKPALAENPRLGHRSNATVAAVQAAFGAGKAEARPSEKDRAELRRQALSWLRADLGAWAKLAQSDQSARTNLQVALRHWQQVPALANVRDKEALAKLPETERAAWQKLWADVAERLN